MKWCVTNVMFNNQRNSITVGPFDTKSQAALWRENHGDAGELRVLCAEGEADMVLNDLSTREDA